MAKRNNNQYVQVTKARTELVDIADEAKSLTKEQYTEINRRLLIVFHLMLVSDKIMAEVEDMLEEMLKFRYTIKRQHKHIAGEIHNEYIKQFRNIDTSELGGMNIDNEEILRMMYAFVGILPGKKVEVTDIPTEGEAMTIRKHKVTGDYHLTNGDGWTISIPLAMHDTCVKMGRELREEIEDNQPHPVGVKIWIGKEKEEDNQLTND